MSDFFSVGNIGVIGGILVFLLIIFGGKKVLESWITYVVIAVVVGGFLLYNSGIAPSKWIAAGTEFVTTFTDKFPSIKTPEGAVRNKSELVPGTWAFFIPKKNSITRMASVTNKTNVALILSRAPATDTWMLGITSFKPNPPFSYPLATIVIVKNGLKHKLSCGLFNGQLRQCDKNGQMSAMILTTSDIRKLAEGSTVTLTIDGPASISWTFPLTGSALAIKNIVNWK